MLEHLPRLATLAAAAAATGPALASLHQICFEGEPDRRSGSRIVVAVCDDDTGGGCKVGATDGVNRVAPVTPSTPQPLALQPPAPGASRTVAIFPFASDMRVQFGFANGAQRDCWMYAADTRRAAGTLASFSTDASGLATTGVWQQQATSPGVAQPRLPAGFLPVGGGTVVADKKGWLFDSHSHWNSAATWYSQGLVGGSLPAGDVTGYAVGLRIGHLSDSQMNALNGWTTFASPPAPATVARAAAFSPLVPGTVEPAYTLVGGGYWGTVFRYPTGEVYAAASQPLESIAWLLCGLAIPRPTSCPAPKLSGWAVESKHPVGASTGEADASATLLPLQIQLVDPLTGVKSDWELRSRKVEADSAAAVSPSVTARGLRGEYALTDAGAVANWASATGNDPFRPSALVSQIEPRADLGGARAVAQPGPWNARPSTVTAYAVGLKLVPAGTKPETVAPPEWVRTRDYCLVDGRLASFEMCKRPSALVSPAELCQSEPGLVELGYCR